MVKTIFRILFVSVFVFACSEEITLQPGLYGYQVERLLSGQSGAKTWDLIVNSTNCSDSLQLTFELLTIDDIDSLEITQSTYSENCDSLGLVLGRASASIISSSGVFTDSLLFSNDDVWLISMITSQQLTVTIDQQKHAYSAK